MDNDLVNGTTSPAPQDPVTPPVTPSVTEGEQYNDDFGALADFEEPEEIAEPGFVEEPTVKPDSSAAPTEPAKSQTPGQVEVPVQNAQPASQQPPAPPTQSAQVQQPTAPQAQVPPAPAVPQQPQAQPQPQAVPQQQPQTPRGFNPQAYVEYRNRAMNDLANSYKINEQDAAKLVTEPETVLPRMAAEITLNAFESAHQLIMQQLPALVEQQLRFRQAAEDSKREFFKAWPDLDKPEYIPAIAQAAQAYVSAYPQSNAADQVKGIGAMVMLQLGLTPRAQAPVAPVPVAPNPVVQAVVNEVPRPYRPVAPGGSGPAARPSGMPANVFEELINFEEMDT